MDSGLHAWASIGFDAGRHTTGIRESAPVSTYLLMQQRLAYSTSRIDAEQPVIHFERGRAQSGDRIRISRTESPGYRRALFSYYKYTPDLHLGRGLTSCFFG